MTDYKENTRRIAKNTLMLYFRMLFLMFLGLFTSRIVLQALGVSEYGIYNVVGGFVAMFSVISGSLVSATSRFITFELGKGPHARVQDVYSTAIVVQIIISIIIVIIAEPCGLWFIDNKMDFGKDVPYERLLQLKESARWVLHFSLAGFVVNIISVPQMAAITAHEKMSAYAYIGIVDGLLRLVTAILIMKSSVDRLVLYSALMLLTVLVVRGCYVVYCRKHFKECRFKPIYDKVLLKEMFSFAGWEFIGTTSGVLRDHGGNILINSFFATALNSARGLALQLSGAVQGFVTNFLTAVNPQITKSYASGDHQYTFSLVRKASRMSYYLLLVFALPLLFNTKFVLDLWLKDVPDHTVSFVRLFLVFSLSEALARPLITTLLAGGNIRNYQIIVGGLQLLNLPISYLLLRSGCQAEITVVVSIIISQICLLVRLLIMKRQMNFPVGTYFVRVYLNVMMVTSAALIIPFWVCAFLPESVVGSIISLALVFLCTATAILYVGCSTDERRELFSVVLKRFRS